MKQNVGEQLEDWVERLIRDIEEIGEEIQEAEELLSKRRLLKNSREDELAEVKRLQDLWLEKRAERIMAG